MSDIEMHESEDLVIPGSGEIVSLEDPLACAKALSEIRELESYFREAKAILTAALVAESQRLGSKTINLPDGLQAEVRGGTRTLYDAHALEEGLREAGCPEARIATIVKTEITYSVVAGEAKRAAGANEHYAEIIAACSTVVEETPSISVRKR